jgi:hypothetical protein
MARNLGVDITTVHEAGTEGNPYDVQFAFATTQGRCIVTYDRDDFITLAVAWAAQGRDHAGILLVSCSLPSNHFAAIARALTRYHRQHAEEVYPNRFDRLHPAPTDDS